MKEKIKKGIQKFGRSLLLPIAVMAPIGMVMGLTNALSQSYMIEQVAFLGNPVVQSIIGSLKTISSIVFENIPLLFAMGVAYGMAKLDKGIAVFSSVLGYVTLLVVVNVYLTLTNALVDAETMASVGQGMVLGIQTLKLDAAGGIIAGLIAAKCTDKFYKTQLPLAFAFFGGKKFVPIATFFFMIPVGFVVPMVWGLFTKLLIFISPVFMNETFGVGVYWFAHRALIPFGLHHVLASIVRFTEAGGVYMIDGQQYIGILNAANKVLFDLGPDNPAWKLAPGLFKYLATGQMLTTLFRVPAIGLAMYHTAFADNKKIAKGAILTVVLTAFLGNITEPLEFSFLFIAPQLFVVYAILCGVMAIPLNFLNIGIGYIRGTIFDFGIFGLMYENTNWLNLILLGAVNFVVFYFVFKFAIKKFNLETLGREKGLKNNSLLAEKKFNEIADIVIPALGGSGNIKNVDNCVSRLRIDLKDQSVVDVERLKDSGTSGVFFPQENHIHVVFGPYVEFVRNAVDDAMKKG
ncbi:PTS transporter subunit EIIC [Enterococcus canintestini]|uniref:PTS trehalose transporter subunit IIC n=1 Tax=Enterococcus canintestini TaxID=317010 RepID=A0A267HQ27_9ENTE|nr:PTS transporter subunit EIIC [Enterococcus canintestini]PAB00337.1 PTS trehalose transporter subunit IIC [Enterococcus canintestini]